MQDGVERDDIFEFDLLYKVTNMKINQDSTYPTCYNFTIEIDYFGEVEIPLDKLDPFMCFSVFSASFRREP